MNTPNHAPLPPHQSFSAPLPLRQSFSTSFHTPSLQRSERSVGNVTLFFHGGSPLSNFYMCPFEDEYGTGYNCSEQFYHVGKCYVFGDMEARNDIMAMDHPKKMKDRSKQIRGFDTWVCFLCV